MHYKLIDCLFEKYIKIHLLFVILNVENRELRVIIFYMMGCTYERFSVKKFLNYCSSELEDFILFYFFKHKLQTKKLVFSPENDNNSLFCWTPVPT